MSSPPLQRVRDLVVAARTRTAGDAGSLVVAKYTAAAFGLATTVLAARWLGPSPYGLAALGISYCTLLSSLASFKGVTVATHYLSAFREGADRGRTGAICKLSLLLDVGAGLLAAMVALLSVRTFLPWIYPLASLGSLVTVYALCLPFIGLNGVSTAVLTSYGRFRWLAALIVFDAALTLILVGAVLAVGGGVREYVIARAVMEVVSGIAMFAVASKVLAGEGLGRWWRVPLGQIGHLREEIGAFFGWNYLLRTFQGLLDQAPLLIVGRMAGSIDAGYYSLACKVLDAATYLEGTFAQIAYPKLSARSALDDSRKAVRRGWRWTLEAGVPAATAVGALILVAPYLLPFVLGARYAPIVLGSQILLAGAFVGALLFWVQPFYLSYGRVGEWTRVMAVDTLLVLTLAFVVVPWGGWIALCGLIAINRGAVRSIMAWHAG
jgi:O-antigen/teichoic acid export membrane protein